MTYNLAIVLLVALTVNETNSPNGFTNYTEAYRVARRDRRPMLVILNPDRGSGDAAVRLAHWQRNKTRQQLLQRFVVVVLDTGTPHGQTMHRLFGNDPLPHVAVIDNKQRFQVYRSSEPPSDQRLTEILESQQNREGSRQNTPRLPAAFCWT